MIQMEDQNMLSPNFRLEIGVVRHPESGKMITLLRGRNRPLELAITGKFRYILDWIGIKLEIFLEEIAVLKKRSQLGQRLELLCSDCVVYQRIFLALWNNRLLFTLLLLPHIVKGRL